MSLRINTQSTQASLLTQTSSATGKGQINVGQHATGDSLRLSSMATSMTDRIKEQNEAVMMWNNKVIKNDNRAHVKPLKLVDKAVSNIGNTLEAMKTLSMMAEREDLSDEERIDLQIQMIKLQSQLYTDTYRMGLELTGASSGVVDQTLSSNVESAEGILIATMENMKARIAKGDYTPRADGVDLSDFTLTSFLNTWDEEAGEFKRTGRATRLSFKGSAADMGLDAAFLDDLDVSASNSNNLGVAITNVACAKESTVRIQKQIDDLTDFKKEFTEFYENVPEEGYENDGDHNMEGPGDMPWMGALSVVPKSQILNQAFDNTEGSQDYGSGDVADRRIEYTRNERDEFIKKADSFFKDKIQSYLGYSIGSYDADKVKENAANAHTIKKGTAKDPNWDVNGKYTGSGWVPAPNLNAKLIESGFPLPINDLYIEDDTPKKPYDPENPMDRYL